MTRLSHESPVRTGPLDQDILTNQEIKFLLTLGLDYQLQIDLMKKLRPIREITRIVKNLSSRELPTLIWFSLGLTFFEKKTHSLM